MNLSEETKKSLIMTLLGLDGKSESEHEFYEPGKAYVVRTVTMIYLGRLKSMNKDELIFEECAWIPDTSRWNEFLTGKRPNEMEPYKYDVLISRSAILDVTQYKEEINLEVI